MSQGFLLFPVQVLNLTLQRLSPQRESRQLGAVVRPKQAIDVLVIGFNELCEAVFRHFPLFEHLGEQDLGHPNRLLIP